MGKIRKLEGRVARVEPRRIERKVTADVYRTAEWIEARALSIAMHAYRCAECGCRPTRLYVDHIVELADGGAAFDQGNLRPLCGSCHTTKTVAARNSRLAR
jgi:5-methylcytosine-specific restriction endonuclease McrA